MPKGGIYVAEKIIRAIWNLVKGIAILILVIFSLLYVMNLNKPGSSALITKDTKVYSDPAAGFSSDITLTSCEVVEKIGDPNSYGYTKIRFDKSEIGYVPSSYLLDVSGLVPSDIADTTHVAKVDLDNVSLEDLSNDDIVCRALKDLTYDQEESPVSGVYVSVSEKNNFSYFISILEELHIPYGYFIKCDSFTSISDLTSYVSEEIVNTESLYNIIPLTLDLTGSTFSQYELERHFSDEVAFSGVRSGTNYWSLVMHEENVLNDFVSSKNFAIEYEKERPKEYISLVRLNNESLLFSSFLEKYNNLNY